MNIVNVLHEEGNNGVICGAHIVGIAFRGTMKRKPLSADDRVATENLRRIWDLKRVELELTQEKAADALGFGTQGAVSHYLRGYTPLNTDAVLKFAELLRVAPNEIQPKINELLQGALRNTQPAQRGAGISIPLLTWDEVRVWKNAARDQRPRVKDRRWITTIAPVSQNAYALLIRGDSMVNPTGLPSFPEGATIIVDPEAAAREGSFVIALLNGENEPTFKQLVRDGRERFLKSLNPKYPLIEFDEAQGDTIIGVVKRLEMDFD